MKLLEERIRRDGKIREGGRVLKVDSFLNHQMDIGLYNEMGKEFFRLFGSFQHNAMLLTNIAFALSYRTLLTHVQINFISNNFKAVLLCI